MSPFFAMRNLHAEHLYSTIPQQGVSGLIKSPNRRTDACMQHVSDTDTQIGQAFHG